MPRLRPSSTSLGLVCTELRSALVSLSILRMLGHGGRALGMHGSPEGPLGKIDTYIWDQGTAGMKYYETRGFSKRPNTPRACRVRNTLFAVTVRTAALT